MEGLISRKTSLIENVVSFCRYLRDHGFTIGPKSQADALKAMTLVKLTSWDELCAVLKVTLPKNKKQALAFDELFYTYWRELNQAVDSKTKRGQPEQKPNPSTGKKPSFDALKNWLYGNSEQENYETALYSDQMSLTQKDFSTFNDDELWELKKIIRKIAKSIASRKMRRFVSTPEHKNIDLRKIFRNNLKRGGEIVDLYYKQNKETDLNLIILCDVSKSMELYSHFLIQFLYAFQHIYSRIETFVFSTSLYHISPRLNRKNFDLALRGLTKDVHEWSGGTKIGASLHTFVQEYGLHCLGKKTVVVIVSDGWDTGDISLLEQSMDKIYRSSGKVVWLNPLAGARNFRPDTAGMRCALPYIDIFAPVHNIESLKKLPGYLRATRARGRIIRN